MFNQVCVLLCLVISSLVLQKLNLNAYVEVSLTLPLLFICRFGRFVALIQLIVYSY